MKIHTIFGPPGTGKTTELLRKLEEELKSVNSTEIAYVSFTKEGTDQGVRRAMERFNLPREACPYFRTLHSLAFKELGINRDDVIGKKQYYAFSKAMGMRFTGYYMEEIKNADDMYLFFDELYRNNKKAAAPYLDRLDVQKLKWVRTQYRAFKENEGMLDYTDMITRFVERNIAVPVKVAFVDEAQDLTTLQWQMVMVAFRHCERLYLAGDDDQAIYQWAGADVDAFLGIGGDYEVLHHSYRLPEPIRKFSMRISKQINHRVVKEYTGTGTGEPVRFVNHVEDIRIKPEETYMFLSRNNVFLSDVEGLLQRAGLVYTLKGVLSVDKKDMEFIKLYEQLRKTRIIERIKEIQLRKHLKPNFSLEDAWYDSFSWEEDKKAYYRDLIKNKTDITKSFIKVSTIHAIKGDEADHVVLFSDITRSTKENLDINGDSEHRVFYVGATRAKKTLTIIHQIGKYSYPIKQIGEVYEI